MYRTYIGSVVSSFPYLQSLNVRPTILVIVLYRQAHLCLQVSVQQLRWPSTNMLTSGQMVKLFIIYLPFCIPFFCQIFQLSACQVVLPPSINQTSRKPVCHFLYSFTSFGLSLLLIYFSYPPYCLLSLYLFLFLSYYVYVCFCLPFFFICSSFPSSSLHSISYYYNHIDFEPFLFLCLKFWSFIIFVCLLSFFHVLFNSLNYPWMAQMQGNFVKYVHTVEFRIPWKCAYFSVKIQFLKPIH